MTELAETKQMSESQLERNREQAKMLKSEFEGEVEGGYRNKIELCQQKVQEVGGETYEIRKDTNDNLYRLHQLKKDRSAMDNYYQSLNNKITGLKKLQKKKSQNIRILSNKINTLEDRHHQQEGMKKEKEEADRYLRGVRSEKALHKNGYISSDLIRLKRKLDHEIIIDNIRQDKRKKFILTKDEQNEQKHAIERRKMEILEENRNKMYVVQFTQKVSKLSLQRYHEQISEQTNMRVKQERWEQARLAKIAQKKIDKLQKIKDQQMEKYEQSRVDESQHRSQYEGMLEKSYEDHVNKLASMKLSTKDNQSQISKKNKSQLTQVSLPDITKNQDMNLSNDLSQDKLAESQIIGAVSADGLNIGSPPKAQKSRLHSNFRYFVSSYKLNKVG